MKLKSLIHLLILSVFIFSSNSCISQQNDKEGQIDKIFKAWDKDNSPGMAVGVVKNGDLIFAKGYGMANLDHKIPIEPNSVFDIASVSKQFCGLAIGILIDEGKLSEEDDIRKYLPDFPDYGKTITVGNLLHHTSGIRDWPTLLFAAGFQFDDVLSFDHIVNLIYKQKELSFETGTEYVYSNSNYSLLVKILEKITGDNFDSWCREKIFKPLVMSDTHFHIDHRRVVENRVDSYTPAGGNLYMRNANNLCAVGSSSLYTTLEDMAKWVRNFKTGKVGGKEVIEMMTQPYKLDNGDPVKYGFGIGMGKWKDREIWSHSGGWAGFRTILNYLPEEDFGVIVLSNHAAIAPGQLAQQVGDLFFPEGIAPSEEEAEAASEEEAADEVEEGNTEEFDPFKEVEFDPAIFKKYIGDFELVNNPGFILSFTKVKGKFYAQATGQQRFEIFSSSDTSFFLKVVEAWVSFHPDEKGDVNRMMLHQNGHQTGMRVKKQEKFEPGPDELEEYAADYSSEELSVVYKLRVSGDKLILDHERFGEVSLNPIHKDKFNFVGMPGEIVFKKDENGMITEFRFNLPPRTRNILFVKL